MFDIKFIRENPETFDLGLKRRGLQPTAQKFIDLDHKKRAIQTELQSLQQQRNDVSRKIGEAKKQGEDANAAMDTVAEIKNKISELQLQEVAVSEQLKDSLSRLPNLPLDEVPEGEDEEGNVEVRKVGEPTRFDFSALEHDIIGENLGLMDFERAAKMSGSRFVILKGALARMERALAHFMLDLQTQEFGYTEVVPPYLVRDAAAYGTGNLPKFEEDLFHTDNGFWLIPTAEIPLTNLVAGDILSENELPHRYTAYTPCFRSEAGSAGRDTRGMIRQHQFSKVELVSISHPDESGAEHERMLSAAENILKKLEIPYRVMLLCSGDMGPASQKTYDIEVWLPGQERYREISSCSNCGEYQARRMGTRYRSESDGRTHHVHTLNGSGLAVGRTMVAILENYQQEDGSVLIPEALKPYMGGIEVISKNG